MNILISAFDSAYVGYAEMMYKSFSKFNSTKMYCCDCGLNSQDVSKIESLNVEILRSNAYLNVKDGRLFDMILEEFMIGLNWDKLMWADADTLFLKNVEHLFELDFDFIGHPGRNEKGLIIKSKDKCYGDVPKRFPDKNYFATGMWITRSRKLIKEFNDWINDHPNFKGPDSPPMTEIVNERYSSLQLDGNLYNFSYAIVLTNRNISHTP